MLGWPEFSGPLGPAWLCSVIGAVLLGNLCFSTVLACGVGRSLTGMAEDEAKE